MQTADGVVAGSNVIESTHRSCVLIENWTSASQINIRGGMTEKGMLLVGEIHYVAQNTSVPFRGLWTPLPDGKVRQFFEQLNDDGVSWNTWFEGFYTRKSAGQDRQ